MTFITFRRLLGVAALAATQSCHENLGPQASVDGRLFFAGVPSGMIVPEYIDLPGGTITAGGQVVQASAAGRFSLSLEPGPVTLTVSAEGFADTAVSLTVHEGVNDVKIEMKPTPEVVVGSTSILMSAPGIARTTLRFPFKLGALSSDPMPTFTTTGPFSATRGGNDYRARSVVITASGPGSGSVTVTYRTHSATIQVEAVNLKFRTINIGTGNACGIALDGTAWCWGANDSGQLGTSTPGLCNGAACQYGGNQGSESPLPVDGRKDFVQIATAGYACQGFVPKTCGTTCALTASGQPSCWGAGIGTAAMQVATVSLTRLSLRALTPAGNGLVPANCGLATNGTAWCFSSTQVIQDGGGKTFQSYSAGRVHACGVDPSGDVYCWGSNTNGALGIGTLDSTSHPTPEKVTASVKFSSVEVGEHSTCALATIGVIYCWGNGFGATTGNPPLFCTQSGVCQTTPKALPGSGVYSAFARGQYSRACGLTAAGSVDCWTTFDGEPTTASVPPVTMISVGNGSVYPSGGPGLPYDACGLTADGVAYCWRGTSVYKIGQP